VPSTEQPSTAAPSTAVPSKVQPLTTAPPCENGFARLLLASPGNITLALRESPRLSSCGNESWDPGALLPMETVLRCPILCSFAFRSDISLRGLSSNVTTSFGSVAGTTVALHGSYVTVNTTIVAPPLEQLPSVSQVTTVTIGVLGPFAAHSSCGTETDLSSSLPWLFVFQVAALRPRSDLREVVQTTSVVTGTVATTLGNPTTALQQATILSFLELAGCQYSDEEPLKGLSSPLGLAIGDRVGSHYRGAVVVFCICIACLPVILLALVFLISIAMAAMQEKRRKGLLLEPPEADGAEVDSPLQKLPIVPGVDQRQEVLSPRLRAAALLHFPSILLVPFLLLAEGAMLSAVSLLRLHQTTEDVLLALTTVLSGTAVMCIAYAATSRRRWFACTLGPRRREHYMQWESHPRWRAILSVIEGSQEWINTSAGQRTHFKKRFILFFETNRVEWYMLAELSLYLFQSVVIGIRSNELLACRVQAAVLLAAHVAAFGVTIAVIPCLIPLDNIFLVLQRIVTVVCAGITLYSIVSIDGSGYKMVETATSVGSLAASAQTVLILVIKALAATRKVNYWIATWRTRRRHLHATAVRVEEELSLGLRTPDDACRSFPEDHQPVLVLRDESASPALLVAPAPPPSNPHLGHGTARLDRVRPGPPGRRAVLGNPIDDDDPERTAALLLLI
jgi:hypothetical protein